MPKKFLLTGYQWVWVLYIAVAIFTFQLKYTRHIDNNYQIFRQSYYHAIQEKDFYAPYPKEYQDFYYYGPVFPLVVLPSAILPHAPGFLLWELLNAFVLLIGIHLLPFTVRQKTQLLLLCAIEFSNSSFYMQFNPAIAGMIILSFVLVERGKEQWATLFIVLGFFIKLYPIIGLVFFLFSKNKGKFILWTAIWTVFCLVAPLLLSSPAFVIKSYKEWLPAVAGKSASNSMLDAAQDICVMGVVRRALRDTTIPNMPFLIAGTLIYLLPLLRFSQYKFFKYRIQLLASSLIYIVIFSTGAEHPTYIIAVAGVFIWMLMQDRPYSPFNIFLLVLVLVITGLGLTDAMPEAIRQPIIAKYSLKAVPCILIWCIIFYELMTRNFGTGKVGSIEEQIPNVAIV